jgi:dipeptidyl aminopeptidase/acylaminoacyl peptidase
MAGVMSGLGAKNAKDPVDRESAAVQAVVTLFGLSDFRVLPVEPSMKPLFGPLAEQEGMQTAVAEASPITYVTSQVPPFLLIHGDKDSAVPLDQSKRFQSALKAAGARCDLIVIPGGPHSTGAWHHIPGVPDWEKQMVQWLNRVFKHDGPIGEGIRAREPVP